MDNSVTRGDCHSNSDPMDVDTVSETVANGDEDRTNKKCDSPHTTVSSLMD